MNTLHIDHLAADLRELLDASGGIRKTVVQEALDYHNPKNFFQDLLNHGCQSGMVGGLVYYKDTHAFFEENYSEIEEIRTDYEFETGQELIVVGDLKNFLAWFAFERTAQLLADELEI